MPNIRVLVVGASIAGPTTAYWLAKAGAKVTVIERFPELRTNGQAVDIRTAGVSVMRKMTGMEAQVRANMLQIDGMSIVGEDGRSYGVLRPTGNPDQQSLISEYEIYRGKLSRVLYDLTKDNANINYVFGEQIAAMRQDSSGDGLVEVEFQNGLQSIKYDLVVACDGAHSRTRAMGLNCGVREHIIPTDLWTAFYSFDENILNGDKIEYAFSAVGGRSITVGSTLSGGTQSMIMATHQGDKSNPTLPFREALRQGEDSLKQYIRKIYQGMGWKTHVLLENMMESKDFYANEIVQVKVPSLFKGRFVMVGDAGYAAGPTGGGTSLAMTGGYMLAGEIVQHRGNIQAALKGYEKQMRPIIKDMQTIPPLITKIMTPQTAWGIKLRNLIFWFITWTRIVEVVGKYFGAAFQSTRSFPLPEYEWEQ